KEPERCVGCVVLRSLAAIGKAIGQHSLAHALDEGEKNLSRILEATSRQTEAGKRDHRVASPVGEPVIAGDDRAAIRASPHDELIGRERERLSEPSLDPNALDQHFSTAT